MKSKILLVEDDPTLGFLLQEFLSNRSFQVTLARNGADGLRAFNGDQFDLCLLDIMMPAIDGFTLAELIKNRSSEVPIIFLTAKALTEDVLRAFKIGADDYIKKPVNEEELVARIQAVLKRAQAPAVNALQLSYEIGGYTFDPNNYRLVLNGDTRQLTKRESKVLAMLVKNKGQLVTRDHVLETIWGKSDYFNRKSMDVFISRLRKYLAGDTSVKIRNVHGSGFVLSDE